MWEPGLLFMWGLEEPSREQTQQATSMLGLSLGALWGSSQVEVSGSEPSGWAPLPGGEGWSPVGVACTHGRLLCGF